MTTDYAKFTPITEDTKLIMKVSDTLSYEFTAAQIAKMFQRVELNLDTDEQKAAMDLLWNHLDMRVTYAEMDALKPHILAAMQDYAKWFYNKNIPSVEPKSEEECLRTLYENVKDERLKEFLGIWFNSEDDDDDEKFFAKIFPQEDNDPITDKIDLARWVNQYQPPKRTDGLSQDELRELQLKHSCSMLRELLEQKLSEEQKLEENTRNCGEYSKTKGHYENMVAIQRVMTLI